MLFLAALVSESSQLPTHQCNLSNAIELGLLMDGSSSFHDLRLSLKTLLKDFHKKAKSLDGFSLSMATATFSDYPTPLLGVGDYGGIDRYYHRDYCYRIRSPMQSLDSMVTLESDDPLSPFYATEESFASGGDWQQSVFEGLSNFIGDEHVHWSGESSRIVFVVTDTVPRMEGDFNESVDLYNDNWMEPDAYLPDWHLDAISTECRARMSEAQVMKQKYRAKSFTTEEQMSWADLQSYCGPWPIDVNSLSSIVPTSSGCSVEGLFGYISEQTMATRLSKFLKDGVGLVVITPLSNESALMLEAMKDSGHCESQESSLASCVESYYHRFFDLHGINGVHLHLPAYARFDALSTLMMKGLEELVENCGLRTNSTIVNESAATMIPTKPVPTSTTTKSSSSPSSLPTEQQETAPPPITTAAPTSTTFFDLPTAPPPITTAAPTSSSTNFLDFPTAAPPVTLLTGVTNPIAPPSFDLVGQHDPIFYAEWTTAPTFTMPTDVPNWI